MQPRGIEQPSPRYDEEPEDRQEDAKRPRFSLVERLLGKKGAEPELREAEIKPIDEPVSPDATALAERFFQAVRGERRGSARTAEAGIQNIITRALSTGGIKNWEQFKTALRTAFSEQLRDPGISQNDRERLPVELNNMFDGIGANVISIQLLQKEYSRAHLADMEQMIGMNDVRDATHAIDLFDIRYRQTDEGISVDEIRLVQVKTGSIRPGELRDIQMLHQQYLDAVLSDFDAFESQERVRSARERVGSSAEKIEHLRVTQSDTERLASLFDLFSDPLDAVFATVSRGKLSVKELQTIFENASFANKLPAMKLFFSGKNSRELLTLIEEMGGYAKNSSDRVQQLLREWVLENPLSSAEVSALNPDFKIDASALKTTKFSSVTYTDIRQGNTTPVTAPLMLRGGSGAKALTAR
ncbi:MAG: hypothetical protein Q8P82_02030 [bacterium]|nr:hypothetical protein [bacterium]